MSRAAHTPGAGDQASERKQATDYDLILVGGGLANGLIAWRLKTLRPQLRLLLLEQDEQLGGNHTWSFHDADLSPAQHQWLEPLISRRWPRYQVIFPQRSRTLASGYASIFSDDFARVIGPALGDALQVNTPVHSLTPTSVCLASGKMLGAAAVIDGRGAQPSPHLAIGVQAFLGQLLRLRQPHGLEAPIIMDASVDQAGGYRFVYVLPFDADTLLIEDTHYVDRVSLTAEQLRGHIAAYAASRGWQIDTLLREEQGALPIVLAGDFDGFWREAYGLPRSGLRAGLFHPTTGYSLPHAVRLADAIANLEDLSALALFATIRQEAQRQWQRQGYFRLLNRMLFLAGRPEQRWRVMQRFYGLPEGLIQRFYAGRLNPFDKLRILVGKPPVPVAEAARAARLSNPHRIRNNS
ncbi:lycopene beta-cyclase CrtY [Pseudomonas borbori]